MFIFLKMIYYQNDEIGILEVLEIIFFVQPWPAGLYHFLKKILSMDFTSWSWHLFKFLANHKKEKSLNFFPPLSGILKISKTKNETVKRAIYHKVVQLENLFTQIVTNTRGQNKESKVVQA